MKPLMLLKWILNLIQNKLGEKKYLYLISSPGFPINRKKRKSKTKYRLTKEGKILADYLSSDAVTSKNINSMLQKEFINYSFVDLILSLLMDTPKLTIEKLVSSILETTNSTLYSIRTSIRDILDLLVSLELLIMHEGELTSFTWKECFLSGIRLIY